ncbi:hypothetical protein Hanom_Chr11g00976221 [Helianthus anomalus]
MFFCPPQDPCTLEADLHYPKRRCGGLEKHCIRFINHNRRFSPQTTQPASTRIQIIQIIRNPSPPFNQHTHMIHLQLTTLIFTHTHLQR